MRLSSSVWLIYALGGGWGHLTRAVSLARVAQARHPVRILTNSPYTSRVRRAMPELDLVAIDPALSAAAARAQALATIETTGPGCLIVDTFPRGLGGELAGLLRSLATTKVLVHRDLSPGYVKEARLREFVRSVYDLILVPGEGEGGAYGDLSNSVFTEPWLICDPPANRMHVRRRIVVCASGNREELAWYGTVVASLHALDASLEIRCVAPACPSGCPPEYWIDHWPAVDLYPTAGVVIGGAGYNTIHECTAYDVPLVTHPWPRKYDRQWLRARRAAIRGPVTIVGDPRQAAEAAIHQLDHQSSRRSGAGFRNGASQAVALIEKACSS